MVLCQDFMIGHCSSDKLCKNEHVDVRKMVKSDALIATNGEQWPLSCFGPFSGKPSLQNFITDQSFEEIRYFVWLSTMQHQFPAYARRLKEEVSSAKSKRASLLNMTPDIFKELVNLYNGSGATISKQEEEPATTSSDISTSASEGSSPLKSNSAPLLKNKSKSLNKKPAQSNPFLYDSFDGIALQNLTITVSNPLPPNPTPRGSIKRHITNSFSPDRVNNSKASTRVQSNLLRKPILNYGTAVSGSVASANDEGALNENLKLLTKTIVEITEKLNIIEKKVDDIPNEIHHCVENMDKQLKSQQRKSISEFNTGILIQPKSFQSSKNTMDHIKSKINPKQLGTPITFRKNLPNGRVILKSDSENNTVKLKTNIEGMLGEFYTVQEITQGKLRLIIYGLEKPYKSNELLDEIKTLNSSIPENSWLRVVHTRLKGANNKWIAYLEVSANLYERLLNRNIHIGFNKHRVHGNYNVLRCFKCQKYGHLAKFCTGDRQICTKCAGYHRVLDCREDTIKCANCANGTGRQPEQWQHTADSVDCPVFQKAVEAARKKSFNLLT